VVVQSDSMGKMQFQGPAGNLCGFSRRRNCMTALNWCTIQFVWATCNSISRGNPVADPHGFSRVLRKKSLFRLENVFVLRSISTGRLQCAGTPATSNCRTRWTFVVYSRVVSGWVLRSLLALLSRGYRSRDPKSLQ
jgi:hypothetical protein